MADTLTKKQETRKKMLAAAGQSFRSNGYSGIGVDGIAKAAGVTSGAFYAHFGSKDGAFNAALEAGLDEVIESIPEVRQDNGDKWVEVFVNYYLGQSHRNDMANGCAMATLSPEVVRASPQMHGIYETKMTRIADLIAEGLKGGTQDERRGRAWAMLGILTGGLTMARAVKTRKAAEEIAEAIKASALKVANVRAR